MLFLGNVATMAITTFIFDGGQVYVAERGLGLNAAVHLYPYAVVLAMGSVVISKLTDMEPGIVYGFVAAATLVRGSRADVRQDGLMVYVPMIALFLTTIVAWLALPLVRAESESGGTVPVLTESIIAALFVGGVQSILFSMVPIEFVDGLKVWSWNRLAWVSIALPTAFLLFHVMLNSPGELETAADSISIRALVAACVVLWFVTAAVWVFFRWHRSHNEPA
jgi:hypothetical protein